MNPDTLRQQMAVPTTQPAGRLRETSPDFSLGGVGMDGPAGLHRSCRSRSRTSVRVLLPKGRIPITRK